MDTTERLITLRNALATWTPGDKGINRFDMGHWLQKNECGTAACAVGLATTIPALQEEGFRAAPPDPNMPKSYNPKAESRQEWRFVQMFFGLTEEQADYIFSEKSYDRPPSPEIVAARIDEILSSKMSKVDKPVVFLV